MIRDFKIDVFSASGNILRTIESNFFKDVRERGFVGMEPVYDKYSVPACHDKVSINIDSINYKDIFEPTSYSIGSPSTDYNLGCGYAKMYGANISIASLLTDSATLDSVIFQKRTDGTYMTRPTRLWR